MVKNEIKMAVNWYNYVKKIINKFLAIYFSKSHIFKYPKPTVLFQLKYNADFICDIIYGTAMV